MIKKGFGDADRLIKLIIYCNAVMYIFCLLIYPKQLSLSSNPLNFLSPGSSSLLMLGATGTIPIDRFHRWWTLLSANYLHSGILHIVFNMIAFRQISPLIVREYGIYRMFIIYTLSGCLGFFISYLAGVPFTIGASASVCGLIGAAVYYGKSRGGDYGLAVYKQTGGWAVSIFIFGLLMPGINNWGHGGGMFAGAMVGLIMGYQDKRPERALHKFFFSICLAATGITLAWAITTGLYYRLFT